MSKQQWTGVDVCRKSLNAYVWVSRFCISWNNRIHQAPHSARKYSRWHRRKENFYRTGLTIVSLLIKIITVFMIAYICKRKEKNASKSMRKLEWVNLWQRQASWTAPEQTLRSLKAGSREKKNSRLGGLNEKTSNNFRIEAKVACAISSPTIE